MLKLLAMLKTGKILLSLGLLVINLAARPAGSEVFLLSPAEGDYLQGVVTVSGGMDVDGFLSYETSFAYEDGSDPKAWFVIKRDVNQVQKGTLALWDTTTITDGDYRLRVVVQLEDGTQLETIVRNLHVSNYSPIPAAAEPTLQTAPRTNPTAQAEAPPPVNLPPNPAELTRDELKTGILIGLAAVLILLAAVGIYIGILRLTRKK